MKLPNRCILYTTCNRAGLTTDIHFTTINPYSAQHGSPKSSTNTFPLQSEKKTHNLKDFLDEL